MKIQKTELVRTFNLATPRKLNYVLGLLFSSLLDASVPLVMALLLRVVLNAITENEINSLWSSSLLLAALIILLMILIPISHYWFGKVVNQIMTTIRQRVFHHLMELPITYYEKNHSGDSLSRINNDVTVIENAFSGNIRQLLNVIITGVVSAVIMFVLDWRFALAMILLGLLSTYINLLLAKPIRQISGEIQVYAGKQLEKFNDLVSGTRVSRLYDMKDMINRQYKELNHQSSKLILEREGKFAKLYSTNYILLWINNGGMFILGSYMIINGELTLGTLVALILLLVEVNNLFQYTGSMWANLQTSLAGSRRVLELLDCEKESEQHPVLPKRQANSDITPIIEINDVTFGYNEKENIIDGLNIRVEKGQLVALVGPSGSGKSTILKLLLGFYPLQQGEIRLESRSYSNISLFEIREKLAYVSQDITLLEGTIEDNIRFGNQDATFDEIVEVASAANAHDFIMKQHAGYQTIVGEHGTKLSGGQKQRLAIARALLKPAPVLLLDEATSALDSESEQAVQKGMERLMKNKTTIAIAHRISTIKQADVIFVIDEGRIVEQGKHGQLISSNGLYAKLYGKQISDGNSTD